MATNIPSLTLEYIKERCPALNGPDIDIQGQIDFLDENHGLCLMDSYGEGNARLLAANAICYKLLEFDQSQPQPAKSRRAPNGSAVTFDTTKIMQDSRSFIDRYDTANCLAGWIAPDIGLFTFNGGVLRSEIDEGINLGIPSDLNN